MPEYLDPSAAEVPAEEVVSADALHAELVKAEREAHPMLTLGQSPNAVAAITDTEINRLFRLAQALAASRLFKDVTQAEQAFAKLIIGRDLGLTPAQSLSLYAMEGKIEVPYPMLATFVRSRPGYDFAVEWREKRPTGEVWTEVEEGGHDITGARVTFTIDGRVRGVSTWTQQDSERALLTANRGSKTSNHVLYPRNMFLARAMSNGVKFHVPEVLGGLPVYAEGELPRREALGDGSGSGEGPGWGRMPIELAGQVERTIARAEKLGHAGLSNRESVQLRLHGQTDAAVRVWLRESNALLDELKVRVPLTEAGGGTVSAAASEGERSEAAVPDDTPSAPHDGEEASGEVVAGEPVDTLAALAAARVAAASARTEAEHEAAAAEVERLERLAAGQTDLGV